MRIIWKIIIIIFVIILLIAVGFIVKIFVIGSVKDVSKITVSNLQVTEGSVSADVMFMTSADVMSRYSHRYSDDILYIKMKSVLVGGIGGMQGFKIKGNFVNLKRVILEDDKSQKVIWEK